VDWVDPHDVSSLYDQPAQPPKERALASDDPSLQADVRAAAKAPPPEALPASTGDEDALFADPGEDCVDHGLALVLPSSFALSGIIAGISRLALDFEQWRDQLHAV
jgi:hypothetical protein